MAVLLGGENRWVMVLVFALALLLAVYPMPLDWRWWRPEFVLLIVIYWSFTFPDRTSLTLFWGLGLVQDLVEGTPLGQHALSTVLVTYICLQSYRRVSNYNFWQQSLWVFVLVGVSQLIHNWAYSMAGGSVEGLVFLYPALLSALLWPFCQQALEWLRLHYRIR